MTFNATISDIAEVVMGQSPKGEECNSKGLGLPLLNGPTEFASRSPIPVQFTEAGKKFAEYGDILFCVRGSTTGRMNYADQRYVIGRGIAAIRGKNGYPTPYVRAVLEQNLDRLLASATGSTFPNVGRDLLNSFEVNSVSPEEARKINQLLLSLEYKIELNRQINQTLEAMAQAIFKSWFVDFEPVKAKIAAIEAGEDAEGVTRAAMSAISGKTDEELDQLQAERPENYTQLKTTAELFPAAMQNSELGDIPEGWEVKALSKVIDVNPMRRLSKGKLATKVSMADLNTWQSWIDSWQKEEYKSGPKFKNGDTIFARITPSLENGKTAFVNFLSTGETAYGSTEFIVFGTKIISSGSYIFCLSRSEHIRETAINAMTGTSGRQRVPNGCFDHLLICVPPDKIVGKFNEITMSLFRMVEHNSKESINLKEARDSLLPKLLSGEISVGAAEFAEE